MFARKNLDVRRVKTSLVATFAKANPPLIWRFDLDRNHSFTLALQGDDQEWELGVTSPKGEFNPIARFPSREDAEEALASVGAILSKGSFSWVASLFKTIGIGALVGVIILLGLSLVARMAQTHVAPPAPAPVVQGSVAPPPLSPPPAAPAPILNPASPTSAPAPTGGIPMPADDVLKPPAP
jgi:hypothetical protein